MMRDDGSATRPFRVLVCTTVLARCSAAVPLHAREGDVRRRCEKERGPEGRERAQCLLVMHCERNGIQGALQRRRQGPPALR